MHELAITQSVVDTVTARLPDARVLSITLEIGRLSGVVSDSVRFCFPMCVDGTPLHGTELEIIDIPGRAYCHGCDRDIELPDPIPLCPCGSTDLRVTSGHELTIKHVKVA